MIVVVSYGLNPPVYINTAGGYGYTESVTEKEIYIRIAKLAFHAKESPIQTRDEVFNLVSS